MNVGKLEDALIRTGNAKYIRLFAENIKGAENAKAWIKSFVVEDEEFGEND